MKCFKASSAFKKDESGAVTVEWVVLTSAVVGLFFLVGTQIRGGLALSGNNIEAELSEAIDFASNATNAPNNSSDGGSDDDSNGSSDGDSNAPADGGSGGGTSTSSTGGSSGSQDRD